MSGCGILVLIVGPPFLVIMALIKIYGPDAGGALLPIFFGWLILVFVGFRVYYSNKYRVSKTKTDYRQSTSGSSGYTRHRGNCPRCGVDLDSNDPHSPGCSRGGR